MVAVVVLFGWAWLARRFAPAGNTDRTRFDTIVVLGTKTDPDGNPTPKMLSRVNEAVREYERGVAPHILFTGGAVHNRFVEARVMAQVAEARGIPSSAIVLDEQAEDTLQNACNAVHLMRDRGWTSAEIVSSSSHLPRAALIFGALPVQYRVHAAEPLEAGKSGVWNPEKPVELLKTVHFLLWARLTQRCEP